MVALLTLVQRHEGGNSADARAAYFVRCVPPSLFSAATSPLLQTWEDVRRYLAIEPRPFTPTAITASSHLLRLLSPPPPPLTTLLLVSPLLAQDAHHAWRVAHSVAWRRRSRSRPISPRLALILISA